MKVDRIGQLFRVPTVTSLPATVEASFMALRRLERH
jgi:hypothetical protein